jgi:hypothetical protein
MCWQATVLAHGVFVSGEHFFEMQLRCCLNLCPTAKPTGLSALPWHVM